MELEQWKQIKGYGGLYEVSNLGQVRNRKKLLMRPRVDTRGYLSIKLCKQGNIKQYTIHRLVGQAFLEKQDYEQKMIDHINRVKTDNRAVNLRWVTHSQNCMNRSIQVNNTSGYTGVYWIKKNKRWGVFIKIEQKQIHGGNFINLEDAITKRKELEEKYFGEYAVQVHN